MIVWTDELLGLVRDRAAAMASASGIAKELGALGYAVTRSAVIGKCHRAGIKLGCNIGRPRAPGAARKCAANPRVRKPRIVPVGDGPKFVQAPVIRFVETKSDNPVPILKLSNKDCRWPMGGFADHPPYLYCGDPVMEEGCSYCARHFNISIKETKHHVAIERAQAAA